MSSYNRYFLHLSYNGTKFSGWQRQINSSESVQGHIEETIQKVLKKKVTVYGCGRTDSGVHATQYVAHIHLDQLPEKFDLRLRLNQTLDPQVTIHDIRQVTSSNHARFSAISRTYTYILSAKKNAFMDGFYGYYPFLKIDPALVQKVISIVSNQKDFRAYCNTPDRHNNTLCDIHSFEANYKDDQQTIYFKIKANRFLKHQIRILVGCIIHILKNDFDLKAFEKGFETGKLDYNIKKAAPSGLYLSKIEYDFIDFPSYDNFPFR